MHQTYPNQAPSSPHQFLTLPKLTKGDKVAIISPSSGLPGLFPHVFEAGLHHLKKNLELEIQEYPTTRQMGSSLPDRAKDLMAAFTDPEIKGIITSIGGDDQIKLLKHLDPEVFQRNPKPFLGYSDNTNLALFLWQLGIPSYYGGAVMCQFALAGGMQELTLNGIKRAIFQRGRFELEPAKEYTDRYLDFSDPENLKKKTPLRPSQGWTWDGSKSARGILWGGCLEIIDWQLKLDRWLPTLDQIKDTILFFETSEEMPTATTVERVLVALGERGWLERAAGLLWARPKCWNFETPLSEADGESYRLTQLETVLRTYRQYNQTAPVILNMDFGHTDPQLILPMGGKAEINAEEKKIYAYY